VKRWAKHWIAAVALAMVGGCGTPASPATEPAAKPDVETDTGLDAAADSQSGLADAADAETQPLCADGLQVHTWMVPDKVQWRRGGLAGDFSVPLLTGEPWTWSKAYSGCDNLVFLVDTIPVSDLDNTSIWTKTKDIVALLKQAPQNTHFFFVSRQASDTLAQASLTAMQARLGDAVAELEPALGEHWWPRLHVVGQRAAVLEGWIGQALQSHGKLGFGIDRQQNIMGFGLLADVTRFKSSLQSAEKWPWEANLAYARHELSWWNARAAEDQALAAVPAKTLPLWQGEVIEQFAEVTVTFDSVGALTQYDTLEVVVDMRCPDPDSPEPGNCGAWDYIAGLSVYPLPGKGEPGQRLEIARAITSYHRETHWVIDATPLMAELAGGQPRVLRWEWAPEWNKQPTATHLSLRFSNRGKGLRPKSVQLLWTGGGFAPGYDSLHLDQTVSIAPTAKKVELWTLITGHGSADGTQCAEFCNHQHRFSIGAQSWQKDHPAAQLQQGCVGETANGMTPNQGGTWWFGRGGWCPGQQVDPWSVDITAAAPAGSTQTIRYQGLYQNQTPPDGNGNIHATIYLVTYE
jgi:hypothetical protein